MLLLTVFFVAMQPQASSAPLSETRFFRGDNMIYKFKIRCNSGYRQDPFLTNLETAKPQQRNLNKAPLSFHSFSS